MRNLKTKNIDGNDHTSKSVRNDYSYGVKSIHERQPQENSFYQSNMNQTLNEMSFHSQYV